MGKNSQSHAETPAHTPHRRALCTKPGGTIGTYCLGPRNFSSLAGRRPRVGCASWMSEPPRALERKVPPEVDSVMCVSGVENTENNSHRGGDGTQAVVARARRRAGGCDGADGRRLIKASHKPCVVNYCEQYWFLTRVRDTCPTGQCHRRKADPSARQPGRQAGRTR